MQHGSKNQGSGYERGARADHQSQETFVMTPWVRSILGRAAVILLMVAGWPPLNALAVIVEPYTFAGDVKGAPGDLITLNLDVAASQQFFSFFVTPEVTSSDLTFQSVTGGAALNGLITFGDACSSTSGNCGGISGSLDAGRVLSWTFKINDTINVSTTTVTADIKFTTNPNQPEQDLPISIPIQITQSVPEPVSGVLLMIGLGALGAMRMRRVPD